MHIIKTRNMMRIFKQTRNVFRIVDSDVKFFSSANKTFHYQELFDLSPDTETKYKKISSDFVKSKVINGISFLEIEPPALRLISSTAMKDVAHLLRPAHLRQLSNILADPESTPNDKFVALELLKNANIASNYILPGCQDTGTAIIMGKRGQHVLTDGNDEEHLSHGVYDTYTGTNLRYIYINITIVVLNV